jgi:hypothetical protein
MGTFSSAEESLRLANHYRELTDEELIALARQRGELTEAAQNALAMEISSRKLTMSPLEAPVAERPAPPKDKPDEQDPYAAERRLVEIRTVWSEADARQLQNVLDTAGIPFYMGREKATNVDDVTSNFASGVPVGIMQVGLPWAIQAMKNYLPKDERPEPTYEDGDDVAIRCPRCRSTDVVFEQLVDDPASANSGASPKKYQWTCDSCGYEWTDDGVETKAW